MINSLIRTTLIVRNADAMKTFYEQVFGWSISYESELELSGTILPCGRIGDRVKLYIMEGADREIGKIGLLEWLEPRLPDTGGPDYKVGIGDIILVSDAPSIDDILEKVATFPGAKIFSGAKDGTFPDPKGEGIIKYSSARIFDPEGFFYEIYYRYNRPNPEKFTIRRTTCLVENVKRALNFYNETLEFDAYQDTTMQISDTIPGAKSGDLVRFVVCKSQHDYYGMIGALEFIDHPDSQKVMSKESLGTGKAVFVAHTSDAENLYNIVKEKNLEISQELFSREVPRTGNQGKRKMKSMGFRDTEGFIWEVNQRG